ncbi:MAG: sulfite exporter TauE/SafE family protein [Pseudomonadota bacterium]|nr:sulfite exporter TauE/SafE family protein [Pseudomonadota bacterium]
MAEIIKLLVVLICVYATGCLCLLVWKERKSARHLAFIEKLKLAITGFVANIADTVGIGSFAVVVAFDKYWKLMDDQKLPGTLNAHSILPAMCQALFFLQVVQVEVQTLVALIIGASVGGFFGGFFVSRLDKQRIRLLMFIGYLGIAALILASKLGLLPVGGELMGLQGIWLATGVVGMIISGVLPAIGVGAYAPTQVILFLLGMSPLAAFPIMTASGAIQQSVAALAFISRKQVALKASLIMAFAGVVGVLVAAPVITYINSESLRWLLLAVVLYNVSMLWKSTMRKASAEQLAPQSS